MHPLFFITSLSILLLSPTPSFSIDQRYTNCNKTFTCGDIENVSYPFWGSDRPEYCGHPDFKLSCNNNSVPEITIKSAPYNIININSASQILTLARTDYLENLCPAALINTTLYPNTLNYTSDTQAMFLYYNCPTVSNQTMGLSSKFSCKVNRTDVSSYYLARTELWELAGYDSIAKGIVSSLGECVDRVVVAVNRTEIESVRTSVSPDEDNLVEALGKGFGLEWNVNNSLCDGCVRSGGHCGYDTGSVKFSCYCVDQAYDSVCGSGKKSKVPLVVGLGIAGAVVAGILIGGWGLFAVQRRKRIAAQFQSKDLPRTPSSKSLSSTTPSYANRFQISSAFSLSKSQLEKGSTYFGVQVFTYTELEEATNNFDPAKELGDGGFGTVYYGVLNDGRVVAVKRLYENNLRRAEQFLNEIKILADIRHPNLVTLYGCTSRHSRELLLVYEYVSNGTVADHLHGKKAKPGLLAWPVRLSIAIETANALAYLHANDVIHRDVKTNNILLDSNFHVKVADFGLSRLFPNDVTHVSTAPQGTPGYVDPEYYQCYHLTEKSDVYSFGVVLVELISSMQAVDTARHRHDINLANMAVNRIQNQALHELVDPYLGYESDYSARTMITVVAQLAFRCLQQERDMRPSMEEVLDVLRGMQTPESGAQIAEVVDISADDVGLLRHFPPPLSPDSGETDKWVQIKTM